MKSRYIIIFFILFIIISAYKSNDLVIEKIRKNDYDRFQKFKIELNFLRELINKSNNTKTEYQKILIQYQKVRESYKSWEYLAEFYASNFIKEHVNTAPLPKIENNSFGANVIEPMGLQVIDELINEKDILKNKNELIKNIDYVIIQTNQFVLPKIYLSAIFIASRTQLIRILTLGITGFDTPASSEKNALNDAQKNLEAILEDFKNIAPIIQEENKSTYDTIINQLESSIAYLDINNNFDTFNRFEFINLHVNELYKSILVLHKALNYEFPEEISRYPMPVNYLAENIFSDEFLSSNYYLNAPKKFINEESKKLGKMLFFDPILSSNNERSCASCHNPKKAFSDNLNKSLAYNFEGTLKRNSPTLINSVFSDRYFHDLRANSLIDQMEHVITNNSEFNTNWKNVIEKINSCSEYKNQYAKAFNTDTTNSVNIQNTQFAMSAYVSSLNSFNSEFDKLIRNNKVNYTKHEEKIINGFNLFMGKAACGTCHFAPVFNGTVPPNYTESESEVLGVSENPNNKKQKLSNDKGRGQAVLKEQVDFYEYSFKTLGIRNVELTYPYMHNGAYNTLEDVMKFYNNGGGAGVGIELKHQTLSTDKLNLNKSEIADIILFMKSLTDTTNLTESVIILPKSKYKELNSRVVGGRY